MNDRERGYPIVSYNEEWMNNIDSKFKEYGLIVIEDIIEEKECNRYMEEIVESIEKIGTGVKRDNIETWKKELLPPMTRHGLFQSLITNSKPTWELRTNRRIREVFQVLYCKLKGLENIDLIVSQDGINIQPNGWGKYHNNNITSDWAHLDLTEKDATYKCLQGQIVLTQTTGCFRASPKSHKCLNDILDMKKINCKDNWLKFEQTQKEIDNIKKLENIYKSNI